ncbi:MAG: AAA family ATPase, partial [Polyangiaceae bacterium]|nr:AAA family ATPase [Polyangiaceae bacterium]
ADLSDGSLRLLAWFTLLTSRTLPPLACIDEPELGLHPRALPIVAGACKVASARSQLIVATHSPQLLSEFDFEDIAVMRREEGRVEIVRPASRAALRTEVEEFGGEAIARLFTSDELEGRS